MPIIINGKSYQWAQFGKPLDLDSLQKQVISVTIEFPYRVNGNSNFDCDSLTLNLMKDIGVSANSKVYCVKWDSNKPETDTVSNGFIAFKHNHTFDGPKNAETYTHTYDIELYGSHLLPFKGFIKEVGNKPNGFKVTSKEKSKINSKSFIGFGPGYDNCIYNGARILKGLIGTKVFYHRDVQGTVVRHDIVINGSNEVRLVNPLVKGNYNWEGKKTDVWIDWGDGDRTILYNKKINSGIFNTENGIPLTHNYNANAGDIFTITVESIEPLVPIGCTLVGIDGTFPEDVYTKTLLFKYTDQEIIDFTFRRSIMNHVDTIVTLGGGLLANWKDVTDMSRMFEKWTNLITIGDGFFGKNILDNVKSYRECFYLCKKLRNIPEYLLGETNDVVETIETMFCDTNVKNIVRLKNARKLKNAYGVFARTDVKDAIGFLEDAPELTNIGCIFLNAPVKDYNENLFNTSSKIIKADSMFSGSKIEYIKFNMKHWRNIQEMQSAFASCPLHVVEDDTFSGDFGKDSPNDSIFIREMFRYIGTDDVYTEFKPNVFKPFAKLSKKIKSDAGAMFYGAKIQKLHDGMFDNVFRHWVDFNENNDPAPRFLLTDFFNKLKTKDVFGYDIDCINIPRMFRNCFGVASAAGLLCYIGIGYIDSHIIQDMSNVENLQKVFIFSKFRTKIPNTIFKNLRNINNLFEAFYNVDYKFCNETPFDRFLYVNGSHTINCIHAFDLLGDTQLKIYRLFAEDSNFTGYLDAGDWIVEKPSLPQSKIIGDVSSSITDLDSYTIKPLILHTVATSDTTVTLSNGTEADIIIDGSKSTVTLPHTTNLSKGIHKIQVISKTAVVVDGNNFFVTAIDGEYPYNSEIPDYPACYTPREIGRFVYAVCNADSVHSKNRLHYIPILHKNIFDYHDKVAATNFMTTTDDCTKSAYGLQPRIYQYMTGLESFDNMFNTSLPVISDIALPQNGKNISANLLSCDDNEEFVTTNIHVGDMQYNGKFTTLGFGKSQVNTPVGTNNPGLRKKEEYLEMRIEGSTDTLKLEQLIGNPTFPIIVETLSIGQIKTSKHILNAFSETINVTGDYFVRIYSDVPVWVNVKQNITELYGVIPPCDSFDYKFKDIAPNLRRVGSLIFIRCKNSSFTSQFKGLHQFEYFPGTIFWYNYNAIDYEECFAECPMLFKVDDYIITDKIGDINCRNMFANSGVTNVRRPIADDIMGKVDVTGMFNGCTTDFYYGHTNIDKEMFRNIDIYGSSGIKFSGTNSVHSDLDKRYVCLDPSSNDMKISYFVPDGLLDNPDTNWNNTKYMSQSLCNQILYLNPSTLNGYNNVTRYLPFLVGFDTFASSKVNKMIPYDIYLYNEFLKFALNIEYTVPLEFPKETMWRCENMVSISGAYQNSNFKNTNIVSTMPFDCGSLFEADLAYARVTGLSMDADWTMPKSVLRDASSMFEETEFSIKVGAFDTVDKDGLAIGKTVISNMFKGNKNQKEEIGIFKTFGKYLGPVNTGVYWGTSITELDETETFAGCDIEVMDNMFRDVTTLINLPKINHMTNAYSYQHMFSNTGLLDIPYNYIYTTRTDKDIMIDYMFADCPNIFLMNTFIDKRSKGNFSIDYSLKDVLSGIGDDPQIFGHINYDKDPEHRSRVNPFDTKIIWIQVIETMRPNITVKLEGFYTKDLIGFKPTKTMTIMWDDGLAPVVVRNGESVTEQHITYTYEQAGRHRIRVMVENELCYLPTPIEKKAYVTTVDLPTSFKFGDINDIKNKGLFNMFGDSVEHVNGSLFSELKGVGTIEVYNDMFANFKNLSGLEVGILDCMPNLKVMKNFLYNSKGSVELVLESGLLDKLTKLEDIENFAYKSNVKTVSSGLFDNNTKLSSLLFAFSESKLIELPRDLLKNLALLNNVNCMLLNTESFILDESYNNFFLNNRGIEYASQSFLGVKIRAIPTGIMKPLINLTNCAEMFATAHHIVPTDPWGENENTKFDMNDLSVPSGFLNTNSKLIYVENMFAGRKSLKSYPSNIFFVAKSIVNARCMFMQTGITEIHRGTFDGFTNNVDVNFMFYGCRVRGCQKPIINCTGTFKTYGMLYGATGEPTEAELFSGVKTDPADIQSMYRQSFAEFLVDITDNGSDQNKYYLKAVETNSFPWTNCSIDIDWGYGDVISISTDILNNDELKRLSMSQLKPGGNFTARINTPYFVDIGVENKGGYSISKIYGVAGEMMTNKHVRMSQTNYGDSRNSIVVEGDKFYARNAHLESFEDAYRDTGLTRIGSDVFSTITNGRIFKNTFANTKFNIDEQHKPDFSNTPLEDISGIFWKTSLVINNDDPAKAWNPFINKSTIRLAKDSFRETPIITTSKINTTSLENINGCYFNCESLVKTYADILDGARNLKDASNMFGRYGWNAVESKNLVIDGETNTRSIGSDLTNITGEPIFAAMFKGRDLTQESITRIINNFGPFKSPNVTSIDCTSMFEDTYTYYNNNGRPKPGVKINVTNGAILNAYNMFKNSYISNVPKLAVISNSKIDMESMFNNCFADPSVETLNEVFRVPGQTDLSDFRHTELNTLNVFNVSVTPKKVEQASVMTINANSSDSLVEVINDKSIPEYNIGDSISDIITDNTTITVNKSETTIIEKVKEELVDGNK